MKYTLVMNYELSTGEKKEITMFFASLSECKKMVDTLFEFTFDGVGYYVVYECRSLSWVTSGNF